MTERVRLETPREGVALITMTHPDLHNCGSFEAISQLADCIEQARREGARTCVLASGVEGHWLEHAWLPDLHGMVTGGPTSGDGSGWFRAIAGLTCEGLVTIAAISGDCSGGGAELGWACDLRVAEEQATFGQPEVQMGLATGLGGTSRLMRLIGRTATAEMVLDGAPFTARRIYELGGLNRIVPTGQAVDAALAWAERLAERPARSLAILKKTLNDAEELPLSEALANEQRLFQSLALTPEGAQAMAAAQEPIDAGRTLREIYGEPRK
ncbi:MAG: enoyl-CoA hydratase/isomerase family protein [Deltaproteobacteria bacterium]|nr:enoyl-CoA hydratase/isomerase family protein [Deltaproteobacteria bacterium]MBW2445515.1 enoyl-CoA hydratase/isomerase family protein [Deltaproteobacteria bacterium]